MALFCLDFLVFFLSLCIFVILDILVLVSDVGCSSMSEYQLGQSNSEVEGVYIK